MIRSEVMDGRHHAGAAVSERGASIPSGSTRLRNPQLVGALEDRDGVSRSRNVRGARHRAWRAGPVGACATRRRDRTVEDGVPVATAWNLLRFLDLDKPPPSQTSSLKPSPVRRLSPHYGMTYVAPWSRSSSSPRSASSDRPAPGRTRRDPASSIELLPPFDERALRGLDGFSHCIVVYVIDQAAWDESRVLRRPRGNPAWPEIGIFAQRAKDRPNRLGVTTCRILGIDGAVYRRPGWRDRQRPGARRQAAPASSAAG
jgi:tRNA (Thr-GGU) A37 N-methylase